MENNTPSTPETVTVSKEQLDAMKAKIASTDELLTKVNTIAEQNEKLQKALGKGNPFGGIIGVNDAITQRDKVNHARAEYVKGVMTNDVQRIEKAYPGYREKALFNEGNDGQGAYPLPEEWAMEIFAALDEYGFAPRLFRRMTMKRNKQNLTKRSSISAAFVAEGAAATIFDATSFYTREQLVAKLLKVAVGMTEEWEEDIDASTIEDITLEMKRALAAELDRVAFNGNTGSSDAFNGILQAVTTNIVRAGGSNSSGATAFSDLSWTDLVPLVTAVPMDRGNKIFVTSQTVYQNLRQETAGASDKTPVWGRTAPLGIARQIGLEGLEQNTVWTPLDIPMVVIPDAAWPSSAANKAAVAYGDFGQYAVLGDRKQVTAKRFTEYYNSTALSGQNSVMELSQRVAIGFPDETAFALLKTATS